MPQNYNACFPATTPPTLYTGTGTTTTFATGFPSLKQNDVVVFTGDNTTGVWNQTPQADYAVNSQNANNVPQVVFNTAPGQDVLIMRRTDLCVLVRNFQAGQSIRAQDLNNAFLQQLYLHQEMYSFLEQQFGGPLIPDGSTLQDTFWNKTTDVIDSGEAWVADDAHIATTLAGDQRWLNATGGNVVGGDGITVTEGGGNVTIAQSDLNPSPAGSFTNANITVDVMGRVTAVSNGQAPDGLNFRGTANLTDDGTVPATANNGDIFSSDTAGNYSTEWARIIDGVTTADTAAIGDLIIYAGANDSSTPYDADSWQRVPTGGANLGLWTRTGTDVSPATIGDSITQIGNITGNDAMTISAGGTDEDLTLQGSGTGNTVAGADFVVTGNTLLGGANTATTTVAGPATCNTTLEVTGATTLNDTATLNGATTLNDALGVNATATFDQTVDNVTTLTTADTATVTPDFSDGNIFEFAHTITTMAAPDNAVAGQSGFFHFLLGGSVTGWADDEYEWPGDVPTPTAPALIPFFVRVGGANPRIMMGVPTEEID